MTIIAQFPATETHTVRIVNVLISPALGAEIHVQVVNRQNRVVMSHAMGLGTTEERARVVANKAYYNLRTLGITPDRNAHVVFSSVCAWCHKPGTPGRPLLFGRKDLIMHDSCDNG